MSVGIITHRGLEPSAGDAAWGESTIQAFESQLQRGFGIEFDPNPTADGGWVVWHDSTLERLTGGDDCRSIKDVTASEIAGRQFGRGRVGLLNEVLALIAELGSPAAPSALHLKGERQNVAHLQSLVAVLKQIPAALPKLFAFDLLPETSSFLANHLPALALAPSVSHHADVVRYNDCVHGTLWGLSAVEAAAVAAPERFSWAWVDEWDLQDPQGPHGRKEPPFAATPTFARLRALGLKVRGCG